MPINIYLSAELNVTTGLLGVGCVHQTTAGLTNTIPYTGRPPVAKLVETESNLASAELIKYLEEITVKYKESPYSRLVLISDINLGEPGGAMKGFFLDRSLEEIVAPKPLSMILISATRRY